MRHGIKQHLKGRRADTLEYIRSMLGQLQSMADAEQCDMLSYLIEMAHIESTDILRGERPLQIARNKGDEAPGLSAKATGKIKFQ